MKHQNARDIFPEALLKQIQKYVSGRTIYIPATSEKKAWGETSGYKRYIAERNVEIRDRFKSGADIEFLADTYGLSPETIKRIVYSKKELILLDYACTLTAATAYAKAGKLEQWVHEYLLSDGHNKEFSDGLKLMDRYFIGPLKMPLRLFTRCCGPEENMTYKVNADWFEKHVAELQTIITQTEDMPPLIVHYVNGAFELNDGNHRLEAYNRLGVEEYYVIVWITEESEYEDFKAKYMN